MPTFVGPPTPETPIQTQHARQSASERDRNRLPIGWKVGPVAAALFDAYSTQEAMSRGGEEANPLMERFAGNIAALYGVEAASGLLAAYFADKLAKAGHPTAARVVSGINIGAHTAAGVHNLSSGRK